MMAAHLASDFLSPTGYVLFTGSKEALHGNKKQPTLEYVAKATVMQQALNLGVFKIREKVIYENAVVNVFACDRLQQARNQDLMPWVNYKKDWVKMELVAKMMKHWSVGENRPVNGTYFELYNFDKRGKVALPKYWN
mmetsp:Transcript_18002/g.30651  ORF Transcript_18002/g.30651 Transcript_18002/m.30651 type:complete len:137 (-) Transcript_18002:19-429(-)